MLKNPVLCWVIVPILFVLLTAGYLWVDSVPRTGSYMETTRKKHKRITWIRRLK